MPTDLRALVSVAFWGALRLGEVLALQRRDIDLTAGTLRVERQVLELKELGQVEGPPKAESVRTVHLPEQALAVLREHLAKSKGLPSARLFVRRDGSALRHHHVQTAWQTARAPLGLDQVHLHDLRHAGLTLAAQTGATTAEVMRRAGHSTARAALMYQHAADSRDAVIAQRLSALG
jgi:integrase